MTRYFFLFAATSVGVACGGTADDDGLGAGGTATGGTAASGSGGNGQGGKGAPQAGSSSAGSSSAGASTAGSSSGGASSAGSSTGGSSSGGVSHGGVSQGGSGGSFDDRCPPKMPSGACDAQGVLCEYHPTSGCLCFNSSPQTLFCEQVEPRCTLESSGSGGSGGFAVKIVAPSHLRCACNGGTWTCTTEP